MSNFAWQTWNSSPFSIERRQGKEPGTLILSLSGPLTMRDVYSTLTTTAFNEIVNVEAAPGEDRPLKVILDLSKCPYMDSTGPWDGRQAPRPLSVQLCQANRRCHEPTG